MEHLKLKVSVSIHSSVASTNTYQVSAEDTVINKTVRLTALLALMDWCRKETSSVNTSVLRGMTKYEVLLGTHK